MKLNTKRTVLIGFAFMSILAFWQFYDQVIPHLLENVFGLRTFTTNAIMSIDNILALFMLPLFGSLSDKTHTRLGCRSPYILFGTAGAVILLLVLAWALKLRNFPLFMIALLLLLVTMSIYRSPAVAYMPDVTPKPLRSRANAIINLVGYVGGIFSTLMMMLLLKSEKAADGSSFYPPDQSFTPIFVVVAAFMAVSVAILLLTVKEPAVNAETWADVAASEQDRAAAEQSKGGKLPRDVRKSLILILLSVFLWFTAYNAVTTAFSRYCVSVWGADLSASSGYLMAATIVAILSFIPLGVLSSRVGRKKTILIGILLMSACYFSAIFITHRTPVMYLLFGLVGVGWAAINVNSFPMVVEMSTAGDTGKYTGYYYAFSMAAQIVTPLLSGLLIDYLGLGYKVLFPYAVVFSLLSFLTMTQVRHGDSKPLPKKSRLEAFDVDD
ncbi:MAG: MFS transporter [Clostridia bacterium]|nr:MFS transporter [Clostridia bacterium]